MNIYRVSRTDKWDYDEYDSMIVCAENEDQARQMNPRADEKWGGPDNVFLEASDWEEQWSSWTDSPDNLKVKLLGRASDEYTEPTVLLTSFNAG